MRTHGSIAASGGGRNHSFAITSNGSVLTWGKVLRLQSYVSAPFFAQLTLCRTSSVSWDTVSAATKWNLSLFEY
jgi:hypothetical protein